MIVLDTNVISEMMKASPEASVAKWLTQQKLSRLYTTWINIAEIQRGICRLPNSKRKQNLADVFSGFVQSAFEDRILSFDKTACFEYARLSENREAAGLHLDSVGLMIAAIASANNFKLATRNVGDFHHCGLELINPWPLA